MNSEYLACSHSFPGWDGSLLTAPFIVWQIILSDFGIFLAYLFISWGIFRYIVSKSDPPFADLALLFALFIQGCGWTHLVKIVVLFVPAFWAEAFVQWATFSVSALAGIVWFVKYRSVISYANAVEAMRSIRVQQSAISDRIEHLERDDVGR